MKVRKVENIPFPLRFDYGKPYVLNGGRKGDFLKHD